MLIIGWWFMHRRGEQEQTDRVAEIWAHHQEWGDAVCRQLLKREVAAGMSPDMVRLAWGSPQAVKRPPGQTDEQWLYDLKPSDQLQNYVTFKDGRVIEQAGAPFRAGRSLSPWLIISILVGLVVIITAAVILVLTLARGPA